VGERTQEALRVHFDSRVRLEMHGATLTSDAGLPACRELDDALGLTQAANGICHQVHLERFAVPGDTLLGPDSHTPTRGGMGMLAIDAGGLDVAIDVKSFYPEAPEDGAARIRRVVQHVKPEKLYVTPDGGFGWSPPEMCAQKLQAMVAGARSCVKHWPRLDGWSSRTRVRAWVPG
jgi:Aconitase family (aconitate hydratase)